MDQVSAGSVVRQYTKREKLQNWLYYHVWHLVAAGFLVIVLLSLVFSKTALNRDGYDYYFAYVGAEAMAEEEVLALEEALASLGQDVTGDGTVTVRISQFVAGSEVTNPDAVYGKAAQIAMLTDISEGESYFFLLEDPESFQLDFQILALPDGSPSAEDDFGVWDKVWGWNDCPALVKVKELSGAEGEFAALLDRLYLGRRCFVIPGMEIDSPENEAFWHTLTEAAEPVS